MILFCKRTIGDRTKDCSPDGGYKDFSYGPQGENKGYYTEGLGDHYIFHGVEGYRPEDSGVFGYAGRFAAFITENKLGHVIGGRRQSNHRYHTDHICQVFIWNPDREAVFAFWNANHPQPAAVVEPKKSVVLPEPPVVAVPQEGVKK